MTTLKSLPNLARILILGAALMASAMALVPKPSQAIYPCDLYGQPECGPGKYICYLNSGTACWGQRN